MDMARDTGGKWQEIGENWGKMRNPIRPPGRVRAGTGPKVALAARGERQVRVLESLLVRRRLGLARRHLVVAHGRGARRHDQEHPYAVSQNRRNRGARSISIRN
eukprot:SAG31_NODE_414_length_15953_cov_2.982528_7_plen_104_part_00